MLHFIYRWKDSRNSDEILCTRYVGMTNNPNARMRDHVLTNGYNPEKDAWLQELAELGLEPTVEIIEVIYDGQKTALEREKYWVKHYLAQGCQLLNIRLVPNATKRRRATVKYPYYCNTIFLSERTAKYFAEDFSREGLSEEEMLEDLFFGSLEELERENGKDLTLDDIDTAITLCVYGKSESDFKKYQTMKAQS